MEYIRKWSHLEDILKDYGASLKEIYSRNLVGSRRPTTENTLVNTMTFDVVKDNQTFTVNLNLQEYWKYIENDTVPHWPPPDAIKRWIQIKPVTPYPNAKGKLPTTNQLAYLIGRKISEEGTKGSNDLERAVEECNRIYTPLIQEAVANDVFESLNILKDFSGRGSI